jgi:hypothetical protein
VNKLRKKGPQGGEGGGGEIRSQLSYQYQGSGNDRSNAAHHVPALHACLAGCELLLVKRWMQLKPANASIRIGLDQPQARQREGDRIGGRVLSWVVRGEVRFEQLPSFSRILEKRQVQDTGWDGDIFFNLEMSCSLGENRGFLCVIETVTQSISKSANRDRLEALPSKPFPTSS